SRVSSTGGNQVYPASISLGAEGDGFAVGREGRLMVVGRTRGELSGFATADWLSPDMQYASAVAVGGVGQLRAIRGEGGLRIVAGILGDMPKPGAYAYGLARRSVV